MRTVSTTPSAATLDAIFEALDYSEEANELIWLKATRRISAGTPAGTLNRLGRLVVGFQGRKYPAANLAWFFQHDEWLNDSIVFRDGDPTNLHYTNLIPAHTRMSTNAKAQQMRRYRERVKARKVAPRAKSDRETINLGADGKTWTVYDDRNRHTSRGSFLSLTEAEAWDTELKRGTAFVLANPPKLDQLPADPATPAGVPDRHILTLKDAHLLFAYDDETGAFYYRWKPIREGVPALQYTDRGMPFLRASGRQYPAGMMAWFMTKGVWPKRKQIGYRDGNPRNLALGNLFLKGVE